MRAAVVVFPGSNCDRDLVVALRNAGFLVELVWHKETELPREIDLVGIPGGFSFGDYLRCGAIAARSPIVSAVKSHVERGGFAIGICNGFQVLLETGLLPGALIRNAGLKFICKPVALSVESVESVFSDGYRAGQIVTFPVAHHDGNFVATANTLAELNAENRIAFRYQDDVNGSAERIAGIYSQNRRVLGLMPHPERAADAAVGSTDGAVLFQTLARSTVAA
ncbi:MAG: phosphoribosylformylglycinamidine synthase subunit PurQ [Boseongicola sp.]